MSKLNLYGDRRTPTISGHGVDIASQRIDDLDEASLECIRGLRADSACAPSVFDLGCGFGAHTVRMAEAGAQVMAFDLDDNREEVLNRAAAVGLAAQVSFVQMDIRKGLAPIQKKVDVVYSQRTVHYLTFAEAADVLVVLKAKARTNLHVFLSASGLHSELGEGYAHRNLPVRDRYSALAPAMEEKHAIFGKVCLYDLVDMEQLLAVAGLTAVKLYASPFGNIKAIART